MIVSFGKPAAAQQVFGQCFIAPVDITPEVGRAVLVHPCGDVGDVDRHLLLQLDDAPLAGVDLFVDPAQRPALIAQQDFRQLPRVLHPHAAM